MKPVSLYTLDPCPYCVKLKKHLDDRGISYTEVNVREHAEEFEKIKEETGMITVPMTKVGDKIIVGSDKIDEIEKEFNS